MNAASIAGALADDDRRRVFAAVELGAGTVDEVSSAAALPAARATTALGRLSSVGVVVAGPSGRFEVAVEALRRAAREALARPPRDEHAASPAAVRRVLDAFVVDGRIAQLPAAHAKRRVVLDWRCSASTSTTSPPGAATSSTRASSTAPAASTGALAARCGSTMT